MIYNDLALFINVARTQSFSKAADDLNMPPSRMSRRIAELEDHLGVKLFERTTRQVRLTEEGRLLLDRCQAPIEALQDVSDIGVNLKEQTIRITAPSLAARTTIAQKLFPFIEQHPDIKVDLTTSNLQMDFIRDNIDLAFRVGPLSDSNLIAKRLWDIPYTFCASKDFIKTHQISNTLTKEDFLSLPAIASKYGWRTETGKIEEPINTRHSFDDLELIQSAVSKGLGVALLPNDMAVGDILPIDVIGLKPELRTMYLVYPSRRLIPNRVKGLIDFIAE